MKIDRFAKTVLVLIAFFLALSCVNDLKLSSNSVEAAAPPSFIQVGKAYSFGGFHGTVLEIQSSGWIKTDTGWVNPNACILIKPE